MRKFILHTYDKTKSFDLNGNTFAAEPQGLGNAFSLSYKESEKGKHLTNVKPEFDPITLSIYFNADGTNGYTNYKNLLFFLAECGTSPFLFEYDDGITDKYCDVVLKSAPKSEISEDGVFVESFSFERQTYWYELVEDTFAFGKTTTEQTIPLTFPFGFNGAIFSDAHSVSNNFYLRAPIKLKISGDIFYNLNIYLATAADNQTIEEISFTSTPPSGAEVEIDPTTKKITVITSGVKSNGYDLTDKTKQSFLYLPKGDYLIGANISASTTGRIEISIKRFLYD